MLELIVLLCSILIVYLKEPIMLTSRDKMYSFKKRVCLLQTLFLISSSSSVSASNEVTSNPLERIEGSTQNGSNPITDKDGVVSFTINTQPIHVKTKNGIEQGQITIDVVDVNTMAKTPNGVGNYIKSLSNGDSSTVNLITAEIIGVEGENKPAKDKNVDINNSEVRKQISESIIAENKLDLGSIEVPINKNDSFYKKYYNESLAIVRLILNTTVVTTELITIKGAPFEYAAIVGLVVGGMSGLIQWKSDTLYKWLKNSFYIESKARALGFIKGDASERDTSAKSKLNNFVYYAKWTLLEYSFLTISKLAMSLFDIASNESIHSAVAKTVLSQGFFEHQVVNMEERINQASPNNKFKATVFRNIALFGGSTLSIISAVGVLSGIPYADFGFVLLGGFGVVLSASPKIYDYFKSKQLLSLFKFPRSEMLRCQKIFN